MKILNIGNKDLTEMKYFSSQDLRHCYHYLTPEIESFYKSRNGQIHLSITQIHNDDLYGIVIGSDYTDKMTEHSFEYRKICKIEGIGTMNEGFYDTIIRRYILLMKFLSFDGITRPYSHIVVNADNLSQKQMFEKFGFKCLVDDLFIRELVLDN